ncbi:hypothetical protein [Campylobacter sp. 19-13652]|uniref:hypothetical protein n=1 Tax=Campylobacter sp. 19-13652 TaxID=2840180 RepID=UPI001C74B2D1|nr:hypothetical protein [Campylobacter sp. 19-13652]BCX80056.1 hypothetical protein LBC_15180 [Campylobacter sp. 19-13652]
MKNGLLLPAVLYVIIIIVCFVHNNFLFVGDLGDKLTKFNDKCKSMLYEEWSRQNIGKVEKYCECLTDTMHSKMQMPYWDNILSFGNAEINDTEKYFREGKIDALDILNEKEILSCKKKAQ